MALQPESLFGKKVDADLKELGVWFINTQLVSLRGVPDRIGCGGGRFFAIELKRNRQAAARKTGGIALQKYTLAKIEAAGGFAEVSYPEIWGLTLARLKKYLRS